MDMLALKPFGIVLEVCVNSSCKRPLTTVQNLNMKDGKWEDLRLVDYMLKSFYQASFGYSDNGIFLRLE